MKKLLAAALALLISVSCFLLPAFAAGIGDVNGDGKISAADARLALRAAVGLEKYVSGSAAFTACDVDKNGKITAADARVILRAAVGLERLDLTGAAGRVAKMIQTYGSLIDGLYVMEAGEQNTVIQLIYNPNAEDHEIFGFYVGGNANGYIYEAIMYCGVGFSQYISVAAISDAAGNVYAYGEYTVNRDLFSQGTTDLVMTQVTYEGDAQYAGDLKTMAGDFAVASVTLLLNTAKAYGVSLDPKTDLNFPNYP